MGRKLDLKGKKYNKLTAIEEVGKDKSGTYRWLCKCDCGGTVIVKTSELKNGHVKSCGCAKSEAAKRRIKDTGFAFCNSRKTHGMSNTRIYRIWKDIKRRVKNPNRQNYKFYGARGITICQEWEESFEAFYEWAIKNGYEDNLEIDRIDNDKGYCPKNCHWVTRAENSNNKRTSRLVTYNGETRTVMEWSRFFNIPYTKLIYRLNMGWSLEKAFEVNR